MAAEEPQAVRRALRAALIVVATGRPYLKGSLTTEPLGFRLTNRR
jgi:hypothetical protein